MKYGEFSKFAGNRRKFQWISRCNKSFINCHQQDRNTSKNDYSNVKKMRIYMIYWFWADLKTTDYFIISDKYFKPVIITKTIWQLVRCFLNQFFSSKDTPWWFEENCCWLYTKSLHIAKLLFAVSVGAETRRNYDGLDEAHNADEWIKWANQHQFHTDNEKLWKYYYH